MREIDVSRFWTRMRVEPASVPTVERAAGSLDEPAAGSRQEREVKRRKTTPAADLSNLAAADWNWAAAAADLQGELMLVLMGGWAGFWRFRGQT